MAAFRPAPPPLAGNFNFASFVQLDHGSRQPSSDPVWVTPEVMEGGFATGLAAARLAAGDDNEEWLSTAGFFKMSGMLDSGAYSVETPEEGALLAAVWLIRGGHDAAGRELIATIYPFAKRLRFFPAVTETAVVDVNNTFNDADGDRVASVDGGTFAVFSQSVSELLQVLAERSTRVDEDAKRHQQLAAHRFHCRELIHLHARAVALLDEYHAATNGASTPAPQAWIDAVTEWQRVMPKPSKLSRKHRKGTLGRLDGFVRHLNKNGVAAVKWSILDHIRGQAHAKLQRHKHDDAESRRQAAVRSEPTGTGAIQAMAARVAAAVPVDSRTAGLTDRQVQDLLQPIEVTTTQVPRRIVLNRNRGIATLLRRSLSAPLLDLARQGLIPSAEAIAGFITRLHAAAVCAGYRDVSLRRLIASNAIAFRNRRSLLLLNLEQQVKIDELPWHAALLAAAQKDDLLEAGAATKASRSALVAVLASWLLSAPGTIIPNKLVSASRDLIDGSALGDYPLFLVPELAADIFMGDFSKTVAKSLEASAAVTRGTTYARYYDLDAEFTRFAEAGSNPKAVSTVAGSMVTKYQTAWGKEPSKNDVVNNGRIIEAVQIASTHNLAQVLAHPTIGDAVRTAMGADSAEANVGAVAQKAFAEVLHNIGLPDPDDYHLMLLTVKRVAYAWRQAVFLVSSVSERADQAALVDKLEAMIDERRWKNGADLKAAFTRGLRTAVDGGKPEAPPILAWFGWKLIRGQR